MLICFQIGIRFLATYIRDVICEQNLQKYVVKTYILTDSTIQYRTYRYKEAVLCFEYCFDF